MDMLGRCVGIFLLAVALAHLSTQAAAAPVKAHVVVAQRPVGSYPQCAFGHEPYTFNVTFQTGHMNGMWCRLYTHDLLLYGIRKPTCKVTGVTQWAQGWIRAWRSSRLIFYCLSARLTIKVTLWVNNKSAV